MKIILLTLFTIAVGCESTPQLPYNGQFGDKQIEDQVTFDTQLKEMSGQTTEKKIYFNKGIPTTDEVTEFLDDTLSGPTGVDCHDPSDQLSQHDIKKTGEVGLVNKRDDSTKTQKSAAIHKPEQTELESKIKQNFAKLKGSSEAIEQALCFFNENKDKTFKAKDKNSNKRTASIKNQDYMVIQDFTKYSYEKRLFLINMKTGEIDSMLASHGYGKPGSPAGMNPGDKSTHFSNKESTKLTPNGFLVSGEKSPSSLGWGWHMKLDGLQKDVNDNSRDRLIVMHKAVASYDKNEARIYEGRASSNESSPYLYGHAKDGSQKKYMPAGQTNGCTAVSPIYADELYEKTKNGALYYNFTQEEKDKGPSYCGHSLMEEVK